MAVVGSAEIVVRAITNKVKDDIQKGLRDALPTISSEGEKAGKAYSDGFGKGSSGNLGRAFEDSLKRAGLQGISEDEGHSAGSALMHGVEDEVDKGAASLARTTENAMSRAGKGGGDGFLRGFLSSGFASSASRASEAFTQIIGAGNLLGPSIAGLIGLLGSAAAGLFAMAGAAAQAAGALAVIPGTISVVAQAFGVLKLAFSGVGDAVKAGFKAASDTSTTAANTTISNARAIGDARTALARAFADAKTAEADATARVRDAEIGVANAQRATLAAQKALNLAREEGVKELRDLAFQAEDAGLAEQQAGFDLQDARKKLQEAQALPPDDQARQEAELAFKQADLAYREAKARNQDLQEEQDKAAKKGVKGTDAVTSARKALADAQNSEANAEKSLGDAREARAKVEQQNARSIADAQLRLTRAIQDQSTALGQASTSASAFQQALAKLSPPAQAFVRQLISMKSEFDALKAAAGDELFPKLTEALRLIADNLLPSVQDEFRATGGVVGQLGLDFAKTISTGEGLSNIQDILKGNNQILGIFAQRTETGRSAIGNFVLVATRLLKVIQPITARFAEWIQQLSVSAEKATDTGKETNKLRGFLERAGDVAAQLGDIFKNIGRALLILFDGSKKSGQGLLDSFEKATKQLDKFLNGAREDGSLQQFFKRAAFNLRALGHLFDLIFVQLVKLSDSKSPGKFAKSLEPAVKIFGDIGVALSDASPAIGPFVTQMAKLIKGLTSSGQIRTFLETLTLIAKVLSDIVNNNVVQKILLFVGTFVAIHRAVAFALVPIRFFFLALTGGPINVLKQFEKMRAGIGKIGSAFSVLKNGGGFKAAMGELGKSSDGAKKKLEEQMVVDKLKTEVLEKLEHQAIRTSGALDVLKTSGAPAAGEAAATAAVGAEASVPQVGQSALPPVGGAAKAEGAIAKDVAAVEKSGGKLSKVFGGIGKALGGVVGLFVPFEVGLEGAGAALGAFIVPIIAVVAAIAAFIGLFILLYKQSPQFKIFIDNIVGKIKDLVHWFKDVALPVIVDFAKFLGEKFVNLVVPPLNAFFGVVNEVLPKIGAAFGVAFHAIAEFWTTVLQPVINAIIDIVQFLWKFVISPYLKLIQLEFKIVFALIKFYWNNILKPVINAIIDIIKFLWKFIFKPYFKLISDYVQAVFKLIKFAWNNILHPVINAIGDAIGGLSDIFGRVFDTIRGMWDRFVDDFKAFKNTIGDVIGDIVDAFKGIGNGVKAAFDEVFQRLGQGIKNDIAFLNKYLVGGLNKVTKKFGLTIPSIPIPQFAEGGRVRGPGGERDDKIIAALSNNEFVVKASTAQKVGFGNLEHLNKNGFLPMGGLSLPHAPSLGDIKDLANNTIAGVEDVGKLIAKEGAGRVLQAVVHGVEKILSGPMPRGSFVNDLFYGILDKLAVAAKDLGGDQGKGILDRAPANLRNLKGITKSGKWLFPVAGPWYYNGNYPYGANPSPGYYHTGSDFPAKVGTPLIAMGKGRVSGITNLGDRSYGRYVTIDYGTFQTLYAHMNAFASGLKVGQAVKAGSKIGQVGWYGNVSPKSPAGAHLHLEASRIGRFGSMSSTIDPIALLKKLGFAFAKGGVVSPTDGGVLGLIAEAGHHERIEPLDTEGFSKRDRAILDMIEQAIGKNGGDTLNVYPSKGMDEMELAAAVARRLQFRRRTGT